MCIVIKAYYKYIEYSMFNLFSVQQDDIGAHINVGRTYNHLKMFKEAEDAYLKVILLQFSVRSMIFKARKNSSWNLKSVFVWIKIVYEPFPEFSDYIPKLWHKYPGSLQNLKYFWRWFLIIHLVLKMTHYFHYVYRILIQKLLASSRWCNFHDFYIQRKNVY